MTCPILPFLTILNQICPFRNCRHHIFWDQLKLKNAVETEEVLKFSGCLTQIIRPYRLEEIGKMWGMSRERVRQIEFGAIRKLKRKKQLIKEVLDEQLVL